MRKILIPTDFSENAMNAIKYALELFKYDISEFYIMHAYLDEIYADKTLVNRDRFDEVATMVSDRSSKLLENSLRKIKEISPNPRHTYNIISSKTMLIDEADRIVDDYNIDILVMGTRGKTNDRKLPFGSHTLQVLKYVQCPVLAIPENYKYKQPKHILFPTDYMIPYKQRELKLLRQITSPFRTVIDVLYVSESEKLSMRQEDNQGFIKEELWKGEVNFKIIDEKNISDAVFSYVKSNNIDMVVMVNTRHSFLENLLFETTIDEMSLNIDIPFLTLQNMRRS